MKRSRTVIYFEWIENNVMNDENIKLKNVKNNLQEKYFLD